MSTTAQSVSTGLSGSGGEVPQRLTYLFGFGFPVALLLLAEQPIWRDVAGVALSMQIVGAALLVGMASLFAWQRRHNIDATVTFRPFAPHYVQAMVHTSIFIYWGWYWRPVYDHAGLIIAQLVFAYGFDMLLSLLRRRQWTIGFGPFPIVFSTNLFLLFKPEWFYLQFAVIATGILGKEFIRWNRDGKNTHIFNPSAFSLFVFSVVLILTDTTSWTFAEEIATTLNEPPHIYVHIFLVGLLVQFLFSVTLVTLMSALALVILNLAYTQITGTYFFIDSNIPIAVFLGLHLLITDPATSPRTATGKAVFGLLYGIGVFALYGLLGAAGAPTFYDKLLCVPLLNLMVPAIDRFAHRLKPALARGGTIYSEITPRANRMHMVLWIGLFGLMYWTSFVGPGHKGTDMNFWEQACDDGRHNGCETLFTISRNNCGSGDANSCVRAGRLIADQPGLTTRLEEGHLLSRGCDLGNARSCDMFLGYVQDGGDGVLRDACATDDYASCFILGLMDLFGVGTQVDVDAALVNWQLACDGGWARACGQMGDVFLFGTNMAPDPAKAAVHFDAGCMLGYAPSCMKLGMMYQRGHGVPANGDRATQLLGQACSKGLKAACDALE